MGPLALLMPQQREINNDGILSAGVRSGTLLRVGEVNTNTAVAATTTITMVLVIAGVTAMAATVMSIAVPPGNTAAQEQDDKKCNGCLTHFPCLHRLMR